MENTQGIIVTEADNIDSPLVPSIVYVNSAFEKGNGYTTDEVIDETPRIF